MRRIAKNTGVKWAGLAVCVLVLIGASGQTCFLFSTDDGGGVIISPLAGTYEGEIAGTLTFAVGDGPSQTIDFSSQTEITIGDNGRPSSLALLALDNSGEDLASDLFDVGQEKTFTSTFTTTINGEETTITYATTITVTKASFTDSGFYVVYEFTIDATYEGGFFDGASQHTDGTATYDVALTDGQLDYTLTMEQNYTQTIAGSDFSGTQELTLTGSLTKQ